MKKIQKYLSIFLTIITVFTTFTVAMPVFAESKLVMDKRIIDETNTQVEMTSKIVREAYELREEYAKYFLCEDGSYVAATYSNPVHYKENGRWREINNNLELSDDVMSASGKAMYAPKSGPMDVSIPQSFSNGQKISATNKEHTISFGVSQEEEVHLNKTATVVDDVEELSSNVLVERVSLTKKATAAPINSMPKDSQIQTYNNDAMTVENQSGAVVFANIFNDADLEYIVTTNSIKENIVVHEQQDEYIYSFDMDFGTLVPVVHEDNSISLVEPEDTNEAVFYIEAPYMYDANKEESIDIDMSLEEKDGKYVLTLQASSEWINESERAFPVIIDPTVYLSFNDVFVLDGIYSNSTRVNKELRVGRNLANLARTYIKPVLPSNIPVGSFINEAILTLKQDNYYQAPSASDITIRAYDCYNVASWSPDTITWNNQPFDNSNNGYKNNSGDSFMTACYAKADADSYRFIITSAVQGWYSTGFNNGIMLVSSNESSKTQVDLHSSRATDSSNYPVMYFSYTPPTVSISSWETDSQEKESSLFKITTGSNWTVSSDEDWISLGTTSGSGVGYSKIIVAENSSLEERTGTVTVKVGNTVIGTIAVTQYGADPYLTLSPTELSFDAGRSKRTVNIESNTVWSFEELPEWLTVTPCEGSGNSSVEIETSVNSGTTIRSCSFNVTADTVTKTINVSQSCDTDSPFKPDVYEQNGLVYISSRSFDFNEETDSPEHIEYKLGANGTWTEYNDEPLEVVRTVDTTIYARVCDEAGNISQETSFTLENTLGEYTASYTDIALGEGLFPVPFARTYSSNDGWFFTFEANVQPFTNGYVFTDFYGEKQYYIQNGEGKYLSVYDEELTVTKDESGNINAFELDFGGLTCCFGANGKLSSVKNDYKTFAYVWGENSLTVDGCAVVSFENGKPTKITVTKTDSEGTAYIKEVDYEWTNGNLIKFTDAADIEHNYAYTNGLLTDNDGETVIYSAQGRVKLISQPNGAFVKYTYNDCAENTENSVNIGAVTVSDSRGVTDTLFYCDGFEVSNSFDSYSDGAVYDPDNISNEPTEDTTTQIYYVVYYTQEGSDSEETADNEATDTRTDGSETLEATDSETPLYEEIDESTYAFYQYDDQGRVTANLEVLKTNITVTEETTFAQAEAVAQSKTTYAYDTDGNVIEMITAKRNNEDELENTEKTCYAYNEKGQLSNYNSYDYIAGQWRQVYCEARSFDSYGNLTFSSTTKATYTVDPETDEIHNTEISNTFNYEYDVWNRCVQVVEDKDTDKEKVKTVAYDALDRETQVVDNGTTTQTTYSYENGILNAIVINVNGEVTEYNYDSLGNITSRHDPNGLTAEYDYDSFGNLKTHTYNGYCFNYNTLGSILTMATKFDEDGEEQQYQRVEYTYSPDVKQEVQFSNFSNGQNIEYEHDDLGNISKVKVNGSVKYESTDAYLANSDGTTTRIPVYKDHVNNIKKMLLDTQTNVYDLTTDDLLYSIDTEDEDADSYKGVSIYETGDFYYRTTKDNEDIFRRQVSGDADFTKSFERGDLNGNISETITGSAFSTSYDYNPNNTIHILENSLNGITQTYSYTYLDNGNIDTETLTTVSLGESGGTIEETQTTKYTYVNNQLKEAENNSTKWEYSYDSRGNITSKSEYDVSIDNNGEKTYTPKENGSDSYTYSTGWLDELVDYNGQTITYDESGNPINYLGHNLTWEYGRQLASFDGITYTYNEKGIRVSKTVGDVTTKYYVDDEGNIVCQSDETGRLLFYYDRNDEVIGFRYNNTNYFYVKNLQGDITDIVDNSGNVIASYQYDPWGKVLSVIGSNTEIGNLNPFRYRSYYYDSDIGMYYLRSRYYDPEIGRFLNCDDANYIGYNETKISYNAFVYCENNSINFVDPLGTKKSLNSIYEDIYIFLFLIVIDSYKTAFKIDTDSNKKGIISIDLTKKCSGESFSNSIFEFYDILGNKVFDMIASYATSVFYDDYYKIHNRKHAKDKTDQRYFLFSDSCVSKEVKEHVLGYWYAVNKIRLRPSTSVLYLGSGFSKEKLESSCKKVDIAEQDAAKTRDRSVFGYFSGIRACYKYTDADPYWQTGIIRTYQNVRENWKTSKISTEML